MVNIKGGLLIKIQVQSERLCFHINHVKVVETYTKYTIRKQLRVTLHTDDDTSDDGNDNDCYHYGCVEYDYDGDIVGFIYIYIYIYTHKSI